MSGMPSPLKSPTTIPLGYGTDTPARVVGHLMSERFRPHSQEGLISLFLHVTFVDYEVGLAVVIDIGNRHRTQTVTCGIDYRRSKSAVPVSEHQGEPPPASSSGESRGSRHH